MDSKSYIFSCGFFARKLISLVNLVLLVKMLRASLLGIFLLLPNLAWAASTGYALEIDLRENIREKDSEFTIFSDNNNHFSKDSQFFSHESNELQQHYQSPNHLYANNHTVERLEHESKVSEPKSWILMMLAIGSFAVFRLRHSKET